MYKFSDRIKDLDGTATREIFKLLSKPDIISFAGGMPATCCLPTEIIREIASDILGGEKAVPTLQYGQTEGVKEFLETMRGYMNDLGLKNVELNNLQALSGGQQGLDLLCKAFINKGDTILVENPTYLAFLQIAKTYEANVVGVDADEDGLILSDLEQKLNRYKPKLLYVVPTFSNPTGKTYTVQNRKAILQLCEKYGVVIIEDDPYGRLRFDGDEVPLLKTFDKHDSVVYVTSFSKTVSPSLRVAVACGAPDIIRKMAIGKQSVDVQTPALNQLIVSEYFARGYYYKKLDENKSVYKERKDAMLYALDKYMPKEVSYTRPNGGLFIWATLPEYIDTKAMLPEAIENKVAYIQGCEFYADGSGQNTMRLNFSNSDPDRIDKGIKVISNIVIKKIKEYKK
ncbi:MAG: PLP-dependent aminotransferase family protein [Clostridiales bacterium]|nr:PLP-dependent aminotransferase family protein [Clostridiales bacterium]